VSATNDSTFLYLETRGRKTGQLRQIEIWFVQHAACFYLCAEMREKANWVQNIVAHPAVTFSVGTRANPCAQVPRTAAHARVLDPVNDASLARVVAALFDTNFEWSDGLLVEVAPRGTPHP
jgi:deazaflavin-dependent oxidoreductase (nitroreductase family)